MLLNSQGRLLLLAILLVASSTTYSHGLQENKNKIKSAVFLSPKFVLEPGSVEDKYYYNIEFPRGHIALKSFNAEVIDEAGNPVSLQETYLHHWVVVRYHVCNNVTHMESEGHHVLQQSDHVFVRNSGICQRNTLGQYFGLGSETRRTATHIPDPYGIEIGNPTEIPAGYEEKWMLNVHAIDTRGVEDKMGCTECRCDLYNVTNDESDRPLRPEYKGGLYCCRDGKRCRIREGFEGPRRSLYLRYTVKWVDWDRTVVPVKIYILDVTDNWKRLSSSSRKSLEHDCKVEYEVEPCSAAGRDDSTCIDVKRTNATIPYGGYVIYGVAHQHSGGIGSALYGEDGRVICSSIPTYGEGKEAGNEAGYIVGMSTCYPRSGSVKINEGEILTLESNYSSTTSHTGVMGLFYLLIAERLPHFNSFSRSSYFVDVKDAWY
ncbi:Stress up-regulated Nod 19 [Quillaja saponaria]|uniref:Stress up-regulated Nod 19 n=1 Tax=Quillaja saponaria TaxID=32244 RepID=A0AAD7KUK4_QUISA|nr:Stress up-regulated Nod 19 [Quillaja saponaria]